MDNSNAFNKGVWAELKKIRPMNFSRLNSPLQKKKTKLNFNKTFTLFGHKVFEQPEKVKKRPTRELNLGQF